MEVECSVLGNGEPEASVPGEIVLTGVRLVRLRGQVHSRAAWSSSSPPGCPTHVLEEVRRLAVRHVPARRLLRPRPRRLLRRGRRARAGQRAQHAARASRRRASTRSCGRRPGCRSRSSATGCWRSRSSASRPSARTLGVLGYAATSWKRRISEISALLGVGRELGDPDEVVAVRGAAGVELEALVLAVDRAAADLRPALGDGLGHGARRGGVDRRAQPGSGVSICIATASTLAWRRCRGRRRSCPRPRGRPGSSRSTRRCRRRGRRRATASSLCSSSSPSGS